MLVIVLVLVLMLLLVLLLVLMLGLRPYTLTCDYCYMNICVVVAGLTWFSWSTITLEIIG